MNLSTQIQILNKAVCIWHSANTSGKDILSLILGKDDPTFLLLIITTKNPIFC